MDFLLVITLIALVFLPIVILNDLRDMPNFLKDMPPRSEWFEKKEVRLRIYYNFYERDLLVVDEKKKGFVITHYLRIRRIALKHDREPLYMGEDAEFGISWAIAKP